MSRLHDIERRIDEKLRRLLRSPAAEGENRDLLEVHRAILDEVSSRIDTLPRGKRLFAYSWLTVRVLLPDAARRRLYEIVFSEADALAHDIRSILEEARVEIPDHFSVEVTLVDELPAATAGRGFDITYGEKPSSEIAPQSMSIELTVIDGESESRSYTFSRKRINLGRLADVLDANHRVIRRNDVAFADTPGLPNSTVSRTHAHLEFDDEISQFRLFDDRSSYGTTVLREGNVIPVPQGASKGVPLLTGDEILLGQVRLRFDRAPTDAAD